MCTLVGCAGKVPPKLKAEFHDFMSALFTCGEQRGRDASGFAVWRGNHLVSERRPIPAQDLIQRSNKWRGLIYNPGELYICHTRAATEGDPNDAINNHPHFGRFMVMTHNGGIPSWRRIVKENKLALDTDCDSEVLLRLVEQRASSKEGMRHLFQTMEKPGNNGGFAVAFIDRRNPTHILLGRENSKPLYIFPCKKFNVTFFASTVTIFEDAIKYMYGTSNTITTLCPKEEKCDSLHLYTLNNDGTHTKERMIETYNYNRGYNVYSHSGSLRRLEDTLRIKGTAEKGNEFNYDIRGNLIDVISVGETGPDENIYGAIPKMPMEVEKSLVEFCQGYADWDFSEK